MDLFATEPSASERGGESTQGVGGVVTVGASGGGGCGRDKLPTATPGYGEEGQRCLRYSHLDPKNRGKILKVFEFPKVALAVFNREKGYREEYQLGKVFFIILLRFCLQRRWKKGKEGQKNRSKWVLFKAFSERKKSDSH